MKNSILAALISLCISCQKDSILSTPPPVVQYPVPGPAYDDCYPHGSDDYLHEDYFADCDSTLIWDHYITKKIETIVIPQINDSLGSSIVNLHDCDLTLTDPSTGYVLTIPDVFHYVDNLGVYHPICNVNVIVHTIWGYSEGTHTFNSKFVHRSSGIDMAAAFEDHVTLTMRFDGL